MDRVGGPENSLLLDPLIAGLVEKLPAPGTLWPVKDRLRWLQTAASVFDLLYEGHGEITMHATVQEPVLTPMLSNCTSDEAIERFNKKISVGDVVTYIKDDGSRLATKTRSKAELLSGHTPVVWLERVTGCVALDRILIYTQDHRNA